MRSLPRKTRVSWNEPGHAHFLSFSCYQRLPMLRDARLCRAFLRACERCHFRLSVTFFAYVIMPENVHVLLYPEAVDYEMRLILAALKRPVAAEAKRMYEQEGNERAIRRLTLCSRSGPGFRFWQAGGGYDRNVKTMKPVPGLVDYIHANPVRRLLVAVPEDWRWSSAQVYAGLEEKPCWLESPFG